MGLKMQTYEYKTCSHLMYGGPTAATEVHDLKYMHDVLHSVGWHNEASFSDSHWIPYGGNTNFYHNTQKFPSNWFWLNAAGHALWDCHMDLDAFTRDRESKYYGAAYPAMKKYQDYRRELWAANNNHMGYPFGDARTPTVLLVEGSKEKLLAWLDEAEKANNAPPTPPMAAVCVDTFHTTLMMAHTICTNKPATMILDIKCGMWRRCIT
jgi:hypothetical protein